LLLALVVASLASPLDLVVEGQTCVLITSDQSVVHSLVGGALSLEAGQGHQLPLLDEKVASVLAGETNFLELLTHEFSLDVANALRKSTLDVDGETLGALHSCFHRCCGCWVIP